MNSFKVLLFLITLSTFFIFINSTLSAEITEPIRDGDYIYIDDSKSYLKGTYLATHDEDIEHWAMTKQFTGDCDMAIGFNGKVAWPTKVLLEDPHYIYSETNTSHTFYYVSNFATTTDSQDYGNWYNSLKYKFDHKIHIGYDNITNESIWQDVIGTVAYFDSQTNDGTNYTVTWYTEHSRLEQYQDISNRILSNPIEYEYDGKNLWFVTKDIPMTANEMRKIVIEMDGKMEWGVDNSYKYDIIWKPSHQTIAEAIAVGNLYVLDPLWNSSYDIRLKMPINNTAGAGQLTDFQINTNISTYSANASSLRCYNRTTGNIIAHWNETVNAGNVEEIWTNNSIIASGWDNNTFCAWQTTPTTNCSSSISNTMVFGDDFSGASIDTINRWNSYIGTGCSLSLASGEATFTTISTSGNFPSAVLSKNTCGLDNILEARVKSSDTGNHSGRYFIVGFGPNENSGAGFYLKTQTAIDDSVWFCDASSSNNEWYAGYSVDGSSPGTSAGAISTTYKKFTIERYSTNKARWLVDDVEVKSETTTIPESTQIALGIDSTAGSGAVFSVIADYIFVRKHNDTPPVYESPELEYYIPSLYYNTTPVSNIIYSSPHEYALNFTSTGKTNTNDTAKSTGLSEIVITNYNNSASIVRNFTLTGDDLDWYQAANISGSYSMKNSSGTIQTVADGNFTNNLVAGDYWIESAEISIVLLSQTPAIIYTNSTGFLNISYGITHSVSGLNNTSVSFIYRNYDYDLSDSNHSIRPPANDLASVWNFNGRILRAANRNETPGLNFENNATITGGDDYTWSGLDENSTKLTIVPVNSTYTKVYINATVHCIMPQMWYLDRTDQQQATKTQLSIHKTQNVLIKFWNFEIFKGNTDFLGVGYTDTSLNSNPALWPSDANPVNFYYVNSSYDPATGGDPITSGYAVYMGSLNASGWTDHVYSRSDSNYVRGFIDNNYLHTIIDTTNISYLYFTSNTPSSHPFYINMTNVASSTNRSFADTNTLWAGNTPPYTPQSYTPNVWFAFMKLNMSLDHRLYVADNNNLWGVSSMNRTNITQALFPPTRPVIDHFHFLGDTDYDMDSVYYGNFSIGCAVSSDPDGGDVTHNLTLHYANNLTVVTIINNTFTDKNITHNGVYFDADFNSTPYYSQTLNYTLRLIATDDESETVTVWLNKNFSLDGSPRIITYSPETSVSSSEGENQTFSITTNILGNVTWYLDSVEVFNETGVNSSSYSNSTALAGVYNVTVITTNTNGSNSMTWDWTVKPSNPLLFKFYVILVGFALLMTGYTFLVNDINNYTNIITGYLSGILYFIAGYYAYIGIGIDKVHETATFSGGVITSTVSTVTVTAYQYDWLGLLFIVIGVIMILYSVVQSIGAVQYIIAAVESSKS